LNLLFSGVTMRKRAYVVKDFINLMRQYFHGVNRIVSSSGEIIAIEGWCSSRHDDYGSYRIMLNLYEEGGQVFGDKLNVLYYAPDGEEFVHSSTFVEGDLGEVERELQVVSNVIDCF